MSGEINPPTLKPVKYYTGPVVELIDHMGGDEHIIQAARVSLKGANNIFDVNSSKGLINYLMREKHGSPFEHTSMQFYVKAPIMVFREFMRHRIGFSYNEMSGRYTDLPGEFYLPPVERKMINVGTSAKPEMATGSTNQYCLMIESLTESYEVAWEKYNDMIEAGIANELARLVLPVGIFSQMYVTMNLRSAFSFLSLRVHDETAVHVSRPQREIEVVAEQIEEEVAKLFPIAYACYVRNGRVAP